METIQHARGHRLRGTAQDEVAATRRLYSRNKQWVASENGSRTSTNTTNHVDDERWERGGHRGGRGVRGVTRGTRRFPNVSLRVKHSSSALSSDAGASDSEAYGPALGDSDMEDGTGPEEPEFESQEERERFYQELVKAREVERKKAIAEGKMDDPLVPKRLEDAITMVGTCMDMCPRFERYRRERENNLFEWETIPGTKRVDHRRAVKMYERAAGDKTLPSDLRPPRVIQRTLDYLFHDLIPRGGFSATFNFIRDRTRAVRNDFTMQHQTGPLAIECHDRCARFHILALHLERNSSNFSIALEEQQLMNTLQSLKEFYEDQRGRYQSPTELEMRVYHRLVHIRDQKERHEDIPDSITSHPVFELTTAFRLHVQKKSAPISRNSALIIDAQGMQIFAQLAGVLREQGNVVMIYLVACILERLFGPDMIEDIEGIRGNLKIPDIIDGVQSFGDADDVEASMVTDVEEQTHENISTSSAPVGQSLVSPSAHGTSKPIQSGTLGEPPAPTSKLAVKSAFANIASSQNVFGTSNVFGGAAFGTTAATSQTSQTTSAFPSAFGVPKTTAVATISCDAGALRTNAVGCSSTSVDVQPSIKLQPTSSIMFPSTMTQGASPATSVNDLARVSSESKAEEPPAASRFELNPAVSSFVPSTPTNGMIFPNTPSPLKSSPAPPTSAVEPVTESQQTQSVRRQSLLSARRPSITLPRINTAFIHAAKAKSSPMQPPPLAKIQPISLPSTPTTAHLPTTAQANGISSHVKSTLSFLSSSADILSPLPLSTSGLGLVQNFSPAPSPPKAAAERKTQRRSGTIINGKGKGKEVDNGVRVPTREEMRSRALGFAQKGLLIRRYFEVWKQRAIKQAAWIEACYQSDLYRRKVQVQRQARAEMTKKRRLSMESAVTSDTSPKKRIRGRLSTEYQPPRTDEELTQRLKENHEAHAHRWARGSFYQAFKSHVRGKVGTMPSPWQIWLSTNPDSDATAIWMERKFDVPDSGYWVSENIFSIPIVQNHNERKGFPGVIVFECTPVQNVKDDIERKYHILDDCARLRDIIKVLPRRRHYIPSLLLIRWGDTNASMDNSDFSDMVQKFADDSVIGDVRVFPVTSEAKDLDVKFKEALSNLQLDTTGKLVESLTVQDLFKRFESVLDSFASEWLENSIINGEFDWTIYGVAVKVTLEIINDLIGSILPLLNLESPITLPEFDCSAIDYNDAAYESAYSWLSELPGDLYIERVIQDLHFHREIGQDFPARIFLKHVLDIAIHLTEVRAGKDPDTKHFVMRADIAASLDNLKACIQTRQTSLNHALNRRLRRSPKRRGLSEETEESISVIAKRRRLSESVSCSVFGDPGTVPPSPLLNGRPSPSPSVSTISLAHGDQPRVTVAMLRALTKDLKKKYVSVL
ncbi:hypothetical protein APHAL10511_003065 [Amanita phalloides]|nr:hypothetical protein APHAL10511_003065 [Amanita phalloides]